MFSWSFVLAALALPVLGTVVTPDSIKSPVTLLYQNNLNYTDDANHSSYLLLLTPENLNAAGKACASVGESLLSLATAKAQKADLTPQLNYLVYRGDLKDGDAVWLKDGFVIVTITDLQFGSFSSGKTSALLPALCTQSSKTTTDTNSVATTGNTLSVTNPTTGNTYTGFRNQKSFRFLGIPYSNTPARWHYSSVNPAHGTTFPATTFGPQCFQQYGSPNSETCLFLNVFTPHLPTALQSTAPSALRPVVVWIHGGAFTGGSGSDPTADGGNMASRGDVVVVTINYRLTTLGFLAIPGTNITGNYGIGDQITALQWIQQNIKVFGGDPNRVTIFGQSAGAGSVRALLASPKAKGLFSAAIPGSNLAGLDYATTYSLYYTPAQEYSVAGQAILNETSCLSGSLSAQVACLNAVPAATLVNLPDVARYVIVDGTYIISDGLNVTSQGKTAYVPVLWGAMADDGAAFIGYPDASATRVSQVGYVLYQYPALVDAVNASPLFPTPNTGNATLDLFNLTARLATDVEFRCLDQATVHSGVRNHIFPTAYYYQFDRSYQTPGWDPNAPVCDAPITPGYPFGNPNLPYFKCHSGELYYEFGTFGQFALPYRDDNDILFTQLVQDYWTSFVRTHDPNPDPFFLEIHGYSATIKAIQQSGHWDPVTPNKDTLRRLNWPPKQDNFQELAQCALLEFPVTYYDDHAGSY